MKILLGDIDSMYFLDELMSYAPWWAVQTLPSPVEFEKHLQQQAIPFEHLLNSRF